MIRVRISSRPLKVLGLDVENVPDWFGGGDYVYSRVVCVSRKWMGEDEVQTDLIDWRLQDSTLLRLLRDLREDIESADALLGHNFRHDKKEIQALFAYLKSPLMVDKPTIDTMRCIPSGPPRALEYLCDFYGLGHKPHLSNHDWTLALTRWDKDALAKVVNRNQTDVILTERLYHKEQELGYL